MQTSSLSTRKTSISRSNRHQKYWKIGGRTLGATVILFILLFLWTDGINIYLMTLGSSDYKQVPYLITQLKSHHPRRREAAARALGNVGRRAAHAIPDLVTALNEDDSPGVAANAAWSLGQINGIWSNQAIASPFITPVSPRRDCIDALTKALGHRDREVRRYAAYALSFYGSNARSAVPELTKKLSDDHMAYMAARALGEMGPTARASIPGIAKLLVSSNPGCRAESAAALAKLTPLNDEVILAIAKLTKDDNDLVKNVANSAMEKIRGSPH